MAQVLDKPVELRAPVTPAERTARRKAFMEWIAVHALGVAAALFFTLPFVFVFLTSLMSDSQALSRDLIPHTWEWGNYKKVFDTPGFLTWWKNTLIYAGLGTVLTVVSSIPVAYALAKFRFRGRNLSLMLVISMMMLPPQVVIIPMYLFWAKQLDLSGTLWPLIIPMAFGDAFSIFLLRQFLMTIPNEYLDAAKVDGCGEFKTLDPGAGRAADGQAGHRGRGALPVLLRLERLLRSADLRVREPRCLDPELRPGVVQGRAPHRLESHHGRDRSGHGPCDPRVLLRTEGVRRGCHAHRSEGLTTYETHRGRRRIDLHPELIDGFARLRDTLPVEELVLVDPAPERLELVGGLARRIFAKQGHPGRIVTTDDLDAGVEGADAVLLQLRVGGQAAREQDETWPLECGCVGQETTGAGGLAKALRTVPVVLDIAERVRRTNPDAWIIDFTNPVGIVTRALLQAGHKAVGLCNVAIGFQRKFAGLLGVTPTDVHLDHVGLNHLTWETGVRLGGPEGENVLPKLLGEHGDTIAADLSLPRVLPTGSAWSRRTTCGTSTRTTRSYANCARSRRGPPKWRRWNASC